MADRSSRSYLRDSHGPRAVDASSSRGKGRGGTPRQREGDEKQSHRSKRESNQRSPKKESSHRRKHSVSQATESCSQRPYLELDTLGQPQQRIALGATVEESVLISLRLPSPDQTITASSYDTSSFFAVASLVADSRTGERVPLEAGILTGQKMFDSVQPLPGDHADHLAHNEPCRVPLGYFTFKDMLIRQSGTFRIRISLIRMSSSGNGGGSTVLSVDSEPIKVEQRAIATPRRHHRMYE